METSGFKALFSCSANLVALAPEKKSTLKLSHVDNFTAALV